MDTRVSRFPKFVAPQVPTLSPTPPEGDGWIHEIKHDGYRLIVRRDGDRVRLLTRRGYDWSGRYPLVIGAVRRLKISSIVIDGEAVICGPDGRSDSTSCTHVGTTTRWCSMPSS